LKLHLGDGMDGAVVDTDGGRLSSLVLAGRERLVTRPGPAVPIPAVGWGSFLMAPFVGRLSNGSVRWRGRVEEIPLNWGRHAIHGATFDAEWEVVAATPNAVTLSCPLGGSRWPFRGSVGQRIAIEPGRLSLEAEILAEEPMPAALGWHPWFDRGDGGVWVRLAGDRVLIADRELIPTGELRPVGGPGDLRSGEVLGDRRIDQLYAAVASPIVLRWPDLELRLAFEAPVAHATVFTPENAVCLEPATAWPDSIRLAGEGHAGTGLVELEAGQKLVGRTVWSWQPRDPGAGR
jgi:galactose mutarotase-like enzyme